MIRVLEAGPMTTVQDRGRHGLAHLGVPRAGALDAPAAALANRLLGNDPDAAVLEVLLGPFAARFGSGAWVVVTGATCPVLVDGRAVAHGEPVWVPADAELRTGAPEQGLRSYLAVAGGIAVEPVLGSRSTDTLAWVGPPPLAVGDELPLATTRGRPQPHDTPRPPVRGPLRITPGPREDWFADGAVAALCESAYVVQAESNRVGLRLRGAPLVRDRPEEELPSEGMVLGSVQVPPDGQPVVLLADHPTTGGYPVLGVVREEDLWQCAQLRPGERVSFALDRPPAGATR